MKFKFLKSLLAVGLGMFVLSSCSDNDSPTPDDSGNLVSGDFQLAYYSEGTDSEATYVQGVKDLSSGSISFQNFGFRLPATVTTRFYSSTDGKYVYALDYPAGILAKYAYHGGQEYSKIGGDLNASIPLGVTALRLTKLDDNYALVHAVAGTAGPTQISESVLTMQPDTAQIGVIDLQTMKIDVADKEVIMDLGDDLRKKGYRVFRIDAPVVSGGKAFYGCGLQRYNLETGKVDRSLPLEYAAVLQVDYPSLKNPKIILTQHVQGSTNGYRTPNLHIDEEGNILVLVSSGSNVSIAKIKNGEFDLSFKVDITSKLLSAVSSNGWFYVGNGVAYVPYSDSSSGDWKVARVDIKGGSVVKLDVPGGLDLRDYQYSVARGDKFYMALSPKEGSGHIHIFDINSTSPSGFTKGASITSGAGQYYIGIF